MTDPWHLRLVEVASPLLERCAFPDRSSSSPSSGYPCAVSGGADSTALLLLAFVAGCNPIAHHVDHRLRDTSAEEAGCVEALAKRLGRPFVRHEVAVAPGPNLEARARAARMAVLPAGVATGHTADDQCETVLINLMRGAATDGLSAMRPGRAHPLLKLRRAETRELCALAGLEPVEDPTNLDPAHLRNRVRHELIPMMCALARRDVVPIVARQAQLLGDDAEYLDALAGVLDPLDSRGLSTAPAPLARRAVRGWLRTDHPPSAATVERVLSVARGSAVASEVGSGRQVRRSKGRLALLEAADGADPGDLGPSRASRSPG